MKATPFGAYVRESRRTFNVKRPALARAAGLSVETIRKIENGARVATEDQVEKIVAALGEIRRGGA